MTIQELYSHSSKWTQGATARDAVGNPVSTLSPIAACWCLSGALLFCYPEYEDRVRVRCKLELSMTHFRSIIAFNDSNNFEKVLELVKKADV